MVGLGNGDAAISTQAALTRNARKAAEGKRSELGSGIQIGAYKAVRRPRLVEVFPLRYDGAADTGATCFPLVYLSERS